jgi:hypothetical protein
VVARTPTNISKEKRKDFKEKNNHHIDVDFKTLSLTRVITKRIRII